MLVQNNNPWDVTSIDSFDFLCCPECVFRSKEEDYFQAHALQNHVLSRSLFLESSNKSQEEIKQDEKEQTYSKENENDVQIYLELCILSYIIIKYSEFILSLCSATSLSTRSALSESTLRSFPFSSSRSVLFCAIIDV